MWRDVYVRRESAHPSELCYNSVPYVLQREYDERMHGDPRHVLAIFIEYSCSLSWWALQYKPENDLALTVSTIREIARVLSRGPVH